MWGGGLHAPVGHDHALLAAQDELAPVGTGDFRIEGLREGEGDVRTGGWGREGVVEEGGS